MAAGDPIDSEKPAGPRSSKGMRTRARLLQAAKEVFEEHGFPESRISDIAERAGLSYGSLYHYFSSKEEIFREVAAEQEHELGSVEVGDDAFDATAGPTRMCARLMAANQRYLAEYRAEAKIMGVVEQVSRYDDEVSGARFDRYRRHDERLADVIRSMQDRQLADETIDPTLGSCVLTAMVTRFAEAWFVQGQVDCTFEEGVAQINRLYLNALRAQ
jgi:AcrR family transcriptional regulator